MAVVLASLSTSNVTDASSLRSCLQLMGVQEHAYYASFGRMVREGGDSAL